MRAPKPFATYQRQGIVRKDSKNMPRARSMLIESERKKRSMLHNYEKVGITEDNANDYAEQCYDLLLFLIRAAMYADGFISLGKGSHEAEVAYLRLIHREEKDLLFLDELRYLRNGILYYGKPVDEEYAEKVIVFTKRLQPVLKKIAEEKVNEK